MRSGGQILVDQLLQQRVEHVFCVPGESYLPVLDALYGSPIHLTVCRHESGAVMMADASARLLNRPGVAFVTRGPGATNAAPGIHIAQHDSVPLILFIGQVERGMRQRGAFQEMDYRAFFSSTCKWVTEIEAVERIPEMIARAFHVALQGRPGPVVIALPEDMLKDQAEVENAPFVAPIFAAPSLPNLQAFQSLLQKAQRPLFLIGGSLWTKEASAALEKFVEHYSIPILTSFRRKSLFDSTHINYIGELSFNAPTYLREYCTSSDCMVLLGTRLSEVASQSYQLLNIPQGLPKETVPEKETSEPYDLIHIHPDPEELGRLYHPTLGIQATPEMFCRALKEVQLSLQPSQAFQWRERVQKGRQAFEIWQKTPPLVGEPVDLAAIMEILNEVMPADTIYANGAGNYTLWPARYLHYRGFYTQLAPTSGSMGYGVPAAVAAKRLYPNRSVVAFAGDGCFLMNGQEFATALQYNLSVLVLIIDNGMYGTIRMHQEREYPGRVCGTTLKNPDFSALARAFGGHGERVSQTEEFRPALERAQASHKPSIIHILQNPDSLTPEKKL